MIQIENVAIWGWEPAVRGMRNPMNSWEKSDSVCSYDSDELPLYIVGNNDKKLMKALVAAGTDHRKFMRMITVSLDIAAPLYWWKEFDTYKVGTVANSCSTMHKIHAKEFTLDDFSHEHLIEDHSGEVEGIEYLDFVIGGLNKYRKRYLETNDKKYWWQLIQLLPSSYNQRRTVMLNYEVLANVYKSRKDHKLDEWREFCHWVEGLPYSELISGVSNEQTN